MKISADPSLVFSIYFLLYLQSYVSGDRIPNSLFFFVFIFSEAAVKVYSFSFFLSLSLSLSLILITGPGGEGGSEKRAFSWWNTCECV